ncbi:MAG: hypothetical protein Q9221_006233 [Calogaya cf. arnoldii]
MPNEAIGWTGIPSDVSYIQKMGLEGDDAKQQPQFPPAPEGLEPEDALVVRQELPADFWHYSQRMMFKMFIDVKDFLDEERAGGRDPFNWNPETLSGYVAGHVRGLLKAWVEAPYAGGGKSEFQKLRDELKVRFRMEHVRLHKREYRREVNRLVYSYVRSQKVTEYADNGNGIDW